MRKKKQPTHTDDGTPILNITLAQIRKCKSTKGLVRIPQPAERSKCYIEAAKVIGEREALALPYHGGRMWKCDVKLSDATGATGSNYPTKSDPPISKSASIPTPLFRWYRHSLQLATLPHLLEDIVSVNHKMTHKKKWINLSNDENDSSDEEWEEPEPTASIFEVSNITTSAYEDSYHPLPYITRTWISPDLLRFHSRKSALAHSQLLVEKDLLIDRVLYGYGKNGIRLRPVKPTRKAALEAGMARFLRDGLWIVGQEEMWIEKRRERLNRKKETLVKEDKSDDTGKQEDCKVEKEVNSGEDAKEKLSSLVGENDNETIQDTSHVTMIEQQGSNNSDVATENLAIPKETIQDGTNISGDTQPCPKNVPPATADVSSEVSNKCNESTSMPLEEIAKSHELDQNVPVKITVEPSAESKVDDDKISKTVTPNESDASSHEEIVTTTKTKVRRSYLEPLPPSTHYRLNQQQIKTCYSACIEHYERVMLTVKARSLHHELADGFDVLRERGKGRYDMEIPQFDTEEYSFLTVKNAAWMPIVHKILGDDAILVHKGCFLSLPGSESQVYHQDGLHLHKKCQKPCHAVNVFIPLVDYDMSNGPTEFCLGSHYLGHENFVREMAYTPLVEAGTPVIFDYRLGHRGLRNSSQNCRPVVYLTYSAVASGKEFRDEVNFSRKRYKKLGEFVDKPMSREERAKKRRMW